MLFCRSFSMVYSSVKAVAPITPHIGANFRNHNFKDVVKLALGHGSRTVTDLYTDFDLKPVDEANRKVIDLIV